VEEKRLLVHEQELIEREATRYHVWRHRCADSEKALRDLLDVGTGPVVNYSHDVSSIRGVFRTKLPKPPSVMPLSRY
jgi:hypothetical protein